MIKICFTLKFFATLLLFWSRCVYFEIKVLFWLWPKSIWFWCKKYVASIIFKYVHLNVKNILLFLMPKLWQLDNSGPSVSLLPTEAALQRRTTIPKCDFNKVVKQLYWNHTSEWVSSSRFAAYFQNNFF